MAFTLDSVSIHATGLRLPTHMAIDVDDRVFISEFGGHAVREVTTSGDYSDPAKGALATQLEYPGGLLTVDAGRIVVADTGDGTVREVSANGEVRLLATIPHAYSLMRYRGRTLASYFDGDTIGIVDIEMSGDTFRPGDAFVTDFPCITVSEPFPQVDSYSAAWATTALDDRLLLCHSGLGTIFDVSAGGSFAKLRSSRFAWGLNRPAGMIADPLDRELYVCEKGTGNIRWIRSAGYARFAPVVVGGFVEPVCARFTRDGRRLFVADRAVGAVYVAELTPDRASTATGGARRASHGSPGSPPRAS